MIYHKANVADSKEKTLSKPRIIKAMEKIILNLKKKLLIVVFLSSLNKTENEW